MSKSAEESQRILSKMSREELIIKAAESSPGKRVIYEKELSKRAAADAVRAAIKDRIVGEHFWFTATTLAVNGFLISSHDSVKAKIPGAWVIVGAIIVSLFAIYLVLHRSAHYAGKGQHPPPTGAREERKTARHKFAETRYNSRVVCRHILPAICECSATLFYIVLITLSAVAVCVIWWPWS